jgi:serine/threonine protein kinase
MSTFVECKPLTGFIDEYFTMHDQLGEGGYGVVKSATPTQSGRDIIGVDLPAKVAIKVISKIYNKAHEALVKKEIMFLKLANLPHACKYYGCFSPTRVMGYVYLVMDLVSGSNLYDTLRRTKLNDARKKEILEQLAIGIKELHDIGIIHHDLKLENIMVNIPVNPARPIKLIILDYGISCYIPDKKCNNLAGTKGYRDPHGVTDDMNSMMLADWWAFGLIAIEVFNNRALVSSSSRIKTPVVMSNIPDAYKSLILQLTDEGIKQEERPTSEDVISLLKK